MRMSSGTIAETALRPPLPRSLVPSKRAVGITSIVSGLTALIATLTGRASWILLGACYVAWCYSGWGLYFAGRSFSGRLRMLEYVLVATGVAAALAVASALYLLALGPSWLL